MKKRISVLIVFCLLLSISVLPTQALQRDNDPQFVIRPMFTYIDTFQTTLDITSSGRADVDVYLYAAGAEQTQVRANLQQYQYGRWTTIKTWSNDEQGSSCGLGESWYVTSGYTYRVVSQGYVYDDGVIVESTSLTTQNRSY